LILKGRRTTFSGRLSRPTQFALCPGSGVAVFMVTPSTSIGEPL
jgi:hypothetical protein